MARVIFTPEEESRIISSYERSGSAINVAEEIGRAVPTVKNFLISKNLYKKRILVNDEMREEMKRLYLIEKLSTWQIGKRLGFLNVCVIKNLKKAGVQLRNRSDAAKTYSVNREYFSKIDTETKAYILGLIWADGNMFKDSFTLALQDCDKYILENISKELESTGPLNFRKSNNPKRKNMWALRIHDKEFCGHLKNLGIVERKTSKLSFPYFLDNSMWSSFLLGLLDGDGNVYCKYYENKPLCYRVGIAGSEFVCRDIKDIFLKSEINSCFSQRENSKGCTVIFSGNFAIGFLNYIYSSNTNIKMTRKFDKFKTIIRLLKERKYLPEKSKGRIFKADKIIEKHA